MVDTVIWYIAISILGWLTFPLAFRVLPALSDRGYAVSRVLGLLLWAYIFWVLASLGILHNNIGGLYFSLGLVLALSYWALRSVGLERLKAFIRSHFSLIFTVEILFLIAFFFWAAVRATNPEAVGTEKPMELAFINAILNSPTFPPHDPWLSGYAISYYHFGYVIISMLAKTAGTPGALAFNLGSTLIFALSAIGAYGLVYNLLNANRINENLGVQTPSRYRLYALLGPLFVLIVSNLEGFLHVLHNRGIFWRRDAAGALVSNFWNWLDIKTLSSPPQEPFSWVPNAHWWWWRASRVLQDYDLAGNPKEIIDEFPFFSFLLADLHPHVLAIPFTFLVVTLALNMIFGGIWGKLDRLQWRLNLRTLAWTGISAIPFGFITIGYGSFRLIGMGSESLRLSTTIFGMGVLLLIIGGFILVYMRPKLQEYGIDVFFRDDLGKLKIGTTLHIGVGELLLAAVALGGMAFMNIWDFPFYVALFAAAYGLVRVVAEQKRLSTGFKDFFWMGLVIGFLGVVLYLPFYLGFSSQAGGILPSLIYPTRGAHFWVMFAPLLLPIFAFLLYLEFKNKERGSLIKGFLIALGLFIFLWASSLLLGFLFSIVPQAGEFYQSTLASPGIEELFLSAIVRRFINSGGWLTLLFMLSLTLAQFLKLEKVQEDRLPTGAVEMQSESGESPIPVPLSRPSIPYPLSHIFAILLTLVGLLLVIGPEFFYLRDLFGWRMNTIFKFYYQVWLLWSIAAAYGAIILMENLKNIWGAVFRLVFVLVLGMSLVYPVLSLWTKTIGFQPPEWTLDSTAYLEMSSPDEMAAVRWLQDAPPGVIAEAVPPAGGSYTQYARLSTLSGKSAVLGWVGHENQWRGSNPIIGVRQNDLVRLYCSRDWEETKTILEKYDIRYVVIGPLERSAYQGNTDNCPLGLVESKFVRELNPVFQQGSVTIYEYFSTRLN